MNKQLIEKIIKYDGNICPEFTYKNPLLSRNVTRSLSKSFIKILKLSNKDNNLRQSVLENIKKLCKIEPVDHAKVDENITENLIQIYYQHISDSLQCSDEIDKQLDKFLVYTLKDMDINGNMDLNPEILQALINLCVNNDHYKYAEHILHWNIKDKRCTAVLKDLWNNKLHDEHNLVNNISIKSKPDIERLLLETCCNIIEKSVDTDQLLSSDILHLFKSCSISPHCFQICCSILNSLFISSHFNLKLLKFITLFIENLKLYSSHITISVLYPTHLSHIVVLLDTDITKLPFSLQNQYVESTLKYLCDQYTKSETDLIMLLSHFPHWSNIYFNHLNKLRDFK